MSTQSIAIGLLALLAIPLSVSAQSPQVQATVQPQTVTLPTAQYVAPQATVVQAQPVVEQSAPGHSREIVWGPGPVGLTLAAVGRRLSTLDRRYVWKIERKAYTRTQKVVTYVQVPEQHKPKAQHVVIQQQAACPPPQQVFQYQPMLPQVYMTSEQAPPPPAVQQSATPQN
jgi:hypothetical protein